MTRAIKNWARVGRKRFLEERLIRLIDRLDGNDETRCRECKRGGPADDRSAAQMETTALKVRKELDVEIAKLETTLKKAPATIAEQAAEMKRDSERWPDEVVIGVVETWCARYRLDMPKPMRTVGGST